jgi:hypothetical protein
MSTPSGSPSKSTSGDSAKVVQFLKNPSSSKQERPESPRSPSPAQNLTSPALSNQHSPFRTSSPILKASQNLFVLQKTPELPSSDSDSDDDRDHIISSRKRTTESEKDELVDDIDSLYASDTDFKITEALLASTKPPPSQKNHPSSSQRRRHKDIMSMLGEKSPYPNIRVMTKQALVALQNGNSDLSIHLSRHLQLCPATIHTLQNDRRAPHPR